MKNTTRADGKTIAQVMQENAAFLNSIGIDAKAEKDFEEEKEDFIEATRQAVLNALDEPMPDKKGWTDKDLLALFKVIDKIAERNFLKSKGL